MTGNIEEFAREAFEDGADPDVGGIVRMVRGYSRRRTLRRRFAIAASLAAIAALAAVFSLRSGGAYDDVDNALAFMLGADGDEVDVGGSTADMLMYWQDALYADL